MALFGRKKPKLNVVIVLLDQLRNDMRHVHPVFDRMGRMGTLFSGMVTYAPYTIASLPAILTGVYGYKNGVDAYYKALSFKNDECGTLQEYFAKQGYHTRGDTFRELLLPEKGFDKLLIYEENETDVTRRHRQLLMDLSHTETRFFAFLHYGLIHREMVKNVIERYDDFDDRYFGKIEENAAGYARYVRDAGRYVESLLEVAERIGLLEKTLFVVCTDHGCSVGEKPGEKCYGVYTYDYTIRTWAYFIHEGLVPKGLEIQDQVRSIDIAPTILDLLNIQQNRNYIPIQGASLVGYMRGLERGGREAYIETGGLGGPTPSTHEPNVKCLRTEKWKLIYNTTTRTTELYDLQTDPGENENVAERRPEVVAELMERLKSHTTI